MPEKTSEKILCLISENPRITTRELVDIIGIHERNVAQNLKTLQEQGLLHRIGGPKRAIGVAVVGIIYVLCKLLGAIPPTEYAIAYC